MVNISHLEPSPENPEDFAFSAIYNMYIKTPNNPNGVGIGLQTNFSPENDPNDPKQISLLKMCNRISDASLLIKLVGLVKIYDFARRIKETKE